MICGGLSNLFGPCLGPQQDISIIQRSAPPPAPIIATIYTPPVQQSKQSSYISTAPDKKMNPIISAYAAASGPGIDYSLCGPPPVTWVGTIGNSIPANAIPGGNEKDGLPLYIARGWIDRGLHVGKASGLWWDGARIPYKGKERIIRDYEILVGSQSAVQWIDANGAFNPNCVGSLVLEGGHEANHETLYIARADINGGKHIGKCGLHLKAAHIPYSGFEQLEKKYQVLTLIRM